MKGISNKNMIFYIVSFIVVIGAAISISFAFYNFSRISNTSSELESGTIKMRYLENDDVIDLVDLNPISDESALNDDRFSFEFHVDYVVNDSASITYGLYIDNNSDELEEIIDGSYSIINSSNIKFALDSVDNDIVVNPIYYSTLEDNNYIENLGNLLYTKNVTGTGSDIYKIYSWIPLENSEGELITLDSLSSQTFSFKINVKAIASSSK